MFWTNSLRPLELLMISMGVAFIGVVARSWTVLFFSTALAINGVALGLFNTSFALNGLVGAARETPVNVDPQEVQKAAEGQLAAAIPASRFRN